MAVSLIQRIEALASRLERAKKLVEEGKIKPITGSDGDFIAFGSNGEVYLVNGKCTCSDYQKRFNLHKGWCKHRLAMEILISKGGETRDGAGIKSKRAEAPRP